MPLDPMPSAALAIFATAGAAYDSHHHWRNDAGDWRASVRFDIGGFSDAHIQGEPTALRELAAALLQAADLADAAASTMAEGVGG
jgi:hypothetical protein